MKTKTILTITAVSVMLGGSLQAAQVSAAEILGLHKTHHKKAHKRHKRAHHTAHRWHDTAHRSAHRWHNTAHATAHDWHTTAHQTAHDAMDTLSSNSDTPAHSNGIAGAGVSDHGISAHVGGMSGSIGF